MTESRNAIRWMEALSRKDTVIHRRNPLLQLIITLFFILTVISFEKYSVSQMLPLMLYPAFMMVLGEIPFRFILKAVLPVMPLFLFLGAANPFFDTADWALFPGISVNAGWISAFSLLLRGLLTLTASLIFMATAGMPGLVTALEKLRVPDFFITLLAFTYRYIHILQEEASSIIRAYKLRAPGRKGIALKDWGPLGGQWFIRTCRRADRIHTAMSCRGFSEKIHQPRKETAGPGDYFLTALWCGYFLLCRNVHIPELLGNLSAGISL